MKKKDKQRKEILKYQSNIEEEGHSDKIGSEAEKLKGKVESLEIGEGEFIVKCRNDIRIIKEDIVNLAGMTTLEAYMSGYDDMMTEYQEIINKDKPKPVKDDDEDAI